MSHGDMIMAVAAGADSVGFVTEYPVPVPWNIPRRKSAELVAAAPPFVTTTAVAVISSWLVLFGVAEAPPSCWFKSLQAVRTNAKTTNIKHALIFNISFSYS